MLHLNNTLKITDLSLFKDSPKNNIITIPFGPIYANTYKSNSLSEFAGYNKLSLSCNDDLQINLTIENSSAEDLELVKLKFNNDAIFEFVPCSLINTDTSEVYLNEYVEKNLINLSSLRSNEKLNIKFNIKINFFNLQERTIKSTVKLFPYEKFSNITTIKNCLSFNQSLLQISTDPNKNLIVFENIGSTSIKNTIFKYSIPAKYEVNLDSLNATFNNNKWNLIAEKRKSDIIFKIDFLPQSNNLPERKLKIFLEHKKYNIQLSSVDSSISLDNK